LIFFNKS